jgi:hypothetical protein
MVLARMGIGLRNACQRSPARIVRERKLPMSIDKAPPFIGKSHRQEFSGCVGWWMTGPVGGRMRAPRLRAGPVGWCASPFSFRGGPGFVRAARHRQEPPRNEGLSDQVRPTGDRYVNDTFRCGTFRGWATSYRRDHHSDDHPDDLME